MDIKLVLALVVLLNPFALFIYLKDVMEKLSHSDFLRVLVKATVTSFLICILFAFFGETIFIDIFSIHFESFRMFGGIVLFSFAFLFVVRGHKSMITAKESLDELANELAVPFMVGAGVISVSVLIGHKSDYLSSTLQIAAGLGVNLAVILILKKIKDLMYSGAARMIFDKFMAVLMRLLGFMLGAIGIDMIVTSIQKLWC
jgi:multiple antibiotic resistance protein